MLRIAVGGLIGTVLGVVAWQLLRRPAPRSGNDRREAARESWNIDPGMVITPPEVDSRMVITPPDVDPKMAVTPRPRREDEPPARARL